MPARTLTRTPFLRFALLGDAAASGATGLLLITAAEPLAPLLRLPTTLAARRRPRAAALYGVRCLGWDAR